MKKIYVLKTILKYNIFLLIFTVTQQPKQKKNTAKFIFSYTTS